MKQPHGGDVGTATSTVLAFHVTRTDDRLHGLSRVMRRLIVRTSSRCEHLPEVLDYPAVGGVCLRHGAMRERIESRLSNLRRVGRDRRTDVGVVGQDRGTKARGDRSAHENPWGARGLVFGPKCAADP